VLATLRVTEEALSLAQSDGLQLRNQLKKSESSLASVTAAKKEGEEKTNRELHMLNVCSRKGFFRSF
jgi:hypothetical protein